MKTSRISSALATAGLIAGSILCGATPAQADNIGTIPAGCSITPVDPGTLVVSGQTRVTYGGNAGCNQAIIIFVRLVHNYDGLPDVRVKEHSSATTAWSYYGNTCDNGPTTTEYYSEVGWNTASIGDVQRTSATKTLTHC